MSVDEQGWQYVVIMEDGCWVHGRSLNYSLSFCIYVWLFPSFKKMGKVYLDESLEGHWKSLIREEEIHQITKKKNDTLTLVLQFSMVHIGAQYNCNSFQPDCLKPKAKVPPEQVGGRHTCLAAIFFSREKWKKKVNMQVRSLWFSNAPADQLKKVSPNKLMLYNSKTGKVVQSCTCF